jgi:hypothetical protein
VSKQQKAGKQKRPAKKPAKKNARRGRRGIVLSRSLVAHPAEYLQSADRWPIVECLISEGLWEMGLGQAIITRETPEAVIACAGFLLDVGCLGVKTAFWKFMWPDEYDVIGLLLDFHDKLCTAEPAYFAKLVYQTADYGQSLSFPPHPDFQTAQLLLAGIDPLQCADEFEFGLDGRPWYVPGPNETPEQVAQISDRVFQLGGRVDIPPDDDEMFYEWPGDIKEIEGS